MKKLLTLPLLSVLFLTALMLVPSPLYATGSTCATNKNGTCPAGCIMSPVAGCLTKDAGFLPYVSGFLKNNSYIFIMAAIILVAASGVQYMLAMGSTGEQGKAKERIIGVVTGILFFTLIRFIVIVLNGSKDF